MLLYFPVLAHQYSVAAEVQLYLLSGSSSMSVWGLLENPSPLLGMLLVGVAPGDNAIVLPWVLAARLCWPGWVQNEFQGHQGCMKMKSCS